MRALTAMEMSAVCGGTGVCTPDNSYGGVGDPGSFGDDVIEIYEGLVAATSHIIERVANAL